MAKNENLKTSIPVLRQTPAKNHCRQWKNTGFETPNPDAAEGRSSPVECLTLLSGISRRKQTNTSQNHGPQWKNAGSKLDR